MGQSWIHINDLIIKEFKKNFFHHEFANSKGIKFHYAPVQKALATKRELCACTNPSPCIHAVDFE